MHIYFILKIFDLTAFIIILYFKNTIDGIIVKILLIKISQYFYNSGYL